MSRPVQVSPSIRSIRRRSLAGSWILFWALRKMTGIRPDACAQLGQDVAVVGLQRRRRRAASRLCQP